MSESVKIGGIGKNPAIDKINHLNTVDVKNYAVNKMKEILFMEENDEKEESVPIDFSRINWSGNNNGKKHE